MKENSNRCFRGRAAARRLLDEKIYFQKIPEQLGQPPRCFLNYGLFFSLTRGSPHFRSELFKIKNRISSEIMEITLYRAFWGCSDIFSQIIWKATHTGSSILAFPRCSATFNEFPSNYASVLIIRNRYNPFK